MVLGESVPADEPEERGPESLDVAGELAGQREDVMGVDGPAPLLLPGWLPVL